MFRELLAHSSLELPIYTRAVFLSRFGLVSQSSSAVPLLLLRAGPADFLNGRIPAVPAAAAALPSVEVSRGYIEPEFAGAEASRAANTEFFQRKIRETQRRLGQDALGGSPPRKGGPA